MSTKRKTNTEFIKDAKAIHGDKYDYSQVEYINQLTPVCIICPEHGEFWQCPKTHLNGHGCLECGKKVYRKRSSPKRRKDKNKTEYFKPNRDYQKYNIKTTKDFVEYCTVLHNNKYDYSKVEYVNNHTKVCIICPEHGEFWQTPYQHLIGHGCSKCGRLITNSKQKINKNDFIELSREKYGDTVIYDEMEYVDYNTKVKLICKKHGEFWQTPQQHLVACGCKKCSSEHKHDLFASNKEEFEKRATEVFHGKYSYKNFIYTNVATKSYVTCPEHGDFLCSPANHLKGRGCPICKSEKYVYEERLYNLLMMFFKKDEVIRQYKPKFVTNNKSLDFYIIPYNIAIEHQGSQHYYKMRYDDENEERLNKRKLNDFVKFKECCDNGLEILYFSYELTKQPNDSFHTLIFDEKELIDKILSKKIN